MRSGHHGKEEVSHKAPEAESRWQLILAVGAEGGSIELHGRPLGKAWTFCRTLGDQTPLLLSEGEIRHSSSVTGTWVDGLALFDRYPWAELHPTKVHPEFAERVLAAAAERLTRSPRGAGRLEDWRSICEASVGVPLGHPLYAVITEALKDATFAAEWSNPSDESFRPLAAAMFATATVEKSSDASRVTLVQDLCRRKRTDLLTERFGKRVAPRVINWLGRTDWVRFTRHDWETYFAIATAEDEQSPLAHMRTITPLLARQFGAIPQPLRVPGILKAVAGLAVPTERWQRLEGFLTEADADRRADLIRRAHAVVTAGDFWDFYFHAEGRHLRPFELPAVCSASSILELLASPLAMEAEGLHMRNCLGNRVSRVLGGSRIYFRLRTGTDSSVDAELKRENRRWVPGGVLGPENAIVHAETVTRVRAELQRLAALIGDTAMPPNVQAEDAYVGSLRGQARRSFSAEEIAAISHPLQSIQGQSRSWTNGAFVIFQLVNGRFVQFMNSPDGAEYLCEISSHKFCDEVDASLTAHVVDLIDQAGFIWPQRRDNFMRWFGVACNADIVALAELALGMLAGAFGHLPKQRLMITTHVPD